MPPITIPLINPNEPEVLLAGLHVSEGQRVRAGDPIATLETTKASHELTAEQDGYILGLRAAEGDTLRAGDVLAYLEDSPEAAVNREQGLESREQGAGIGERGTGNGESASRPTSSPPHLLTPSSHHLPTSSPHPPLPPGLRITRPALALARQHGLDLSRLPIGPLVTKSTVRALLEESKQSEQSAFALPETAFDPAAIIIYGAGGHGKSLLDLLRALGYYRILGFVDDGLPAGTEVMGLPVLGGGEVLDDLRARGVRMAVNAVGGIGNVQVRVRVFHKLAEAGFVCPPVVHPAAVIEPGARLEAGVQVMPLAYVGSEAHIGYGTLVNTGAIVSHDCRVGAYVNLSPGATVAGEVTIGEGALVGMRATINLGVTVGDGARIGNGATVKSDVPPKGIVRAGGVWPT